MNLRDPSGHFACGDGISDKRCEVRGEYIGLSKDDAAILATLMAFESTSGAVPDNVTNMKAWALLNLRSYNLKCGSPCNAPRIPFGDWRGHESKLLNDMGIKGSYEEQISVLLSRYESYKAGLDSRISAERFVEIGSATKQAIHDWYLYGSNSSADPVQGATGFTDATGLHYPNGSSDEPYLKDIPNYQPLMTDVSAMEHLRTMYSYTGVVSQLYPFSTWPYTQQNMWTFTWFRY